MKDRLNPLIEERAPWLFKDYPGAARLRQRLLSLVGYEETLVLANAFRDLSSAQLMHIMGRKLAHHVTVTGREHIPKTGAALVVANHPTGIADGIILNKLIRETREDVYFFANHDILRLLPQMIDMLAPVEWREDRRTRAKTRETMAYTRTAVDQGRIGVIFPSGRLAKRRGVTLHERPWMASAAMIARKFELPVIPIRIQARNSLLFYAFDALHPTLRDITLFNEMNNKSRFTFDITIGAPIAPEALPRASGDAIELLKNTVLTLNGKPPGLPMLTRSRQPAKSDGRAFGRREASLTQ